MAGKGAAAAKAATPEVMELRVAELTLWLDARDSGLHMVVPPAHAKFLQPAPAETSAGVADLVLRVHDMPLPQAKPGQVPLCRSEIWELWLDEAGRYVFVAPRQSPPRQIVVDPGFTAGEVCGDFSSTNGSGIYPPQSLDIRLYANWLARYGDVILHAAGVAVDGRGYVFAGSSGAGKSTLAASLASDPSVTVLGEDQAILRYLEGRFWIYGTPWHVNPDLCAPLGVPLEKVFFLDREATHPVTPVAPIEGITRLLQTAFIPYYHPAAVSAILDRLALLAERAPFYTLAYTLVSDVWKLISGA